jgi:hypothetical protein
VQAQLNRKDDQALFTIELKDGKGRGMMTNKTIPKGSRISPASGWTPLVAPVLQEHFRTSRCALCFNMLGAEKFRCNSNLSASDPVYKLLFCSAECRDVASTAHQMQEEERAVQNLLRTGQAPPKIFSTAILLYRILQARKDVLVYNSIEQLQCKPQREDTEFAASEASNYHTQAVIATVMGMLHCSVSSVFSGSKLPSVDYLTDTIQRIKINGFSICDGEFVCCGVGLFSPANFMNHSCRPNSVQTFLFEKARTPSLHATAFEKISPTQEICISYTDTSYPWHLRQQQLRSDYHFDCRCDACSNSKDDAIKMGITCSSCRRAIVVANRPTVAPNLVQHRYRCQECDSPLVDSSVLQLLESFEQQCKDDNKSRVHLPEECRQWYHNLQQHCLPSSWYVQESGEKLLQAHLDRLSEYQDDEVNQQKEAHQALQLCEHLLKVEPEPNYVLTTSEFLRREQLKYKAAKLRLFVDPDPRRSVQELQGVLFAVTPYYPSNHELVLGLQACLHNAMM